MLDLNLTLIAALSYVQERGLNNGHTRGLNRTHSSAEDVVVQVKMDIQTSERRLHFIIDTFQWFDYNYD